MILWCHYIIKSRRLHLPSCSSRNSLRLLFRPDIAESLVGVVGSFGSSLTCDCDRKFRKRNSVSWRGKILQQRFSKLRAALTFKFLNLQLSGWINTVTGSSLLPSEQWISLPEAEFDIMKKRFNRERKANYSSFRSLYGCQFSDWLMSCWIFSAFKLVDNWTASSVLSPFTSTMPRRPAGRSADLGGWRETFHR